MLMLFQQGALGELSPTIASDCHNGSQQPKLAANGKYLRFTALKPVAKPDLLPS